MEHKLLHTTAVVLTLLALVTAQITVTSPSTMEASIMTSRLDDSATTQSTSSHATSNLTLKPSVAQSESPTPSPDLQSTTSNHSEATSPALPPSPHTTSKTTQEPIPQEQRVEISLSFRITNMIFNDSLSNRSSEAFQELERTIGEVYQAVYNCSAYENDYVGYRVNEFRNGSVVADTQIYFRKNSNTTSSHFLNVVEDSLKNASHEALKGLNLTDVTATAESMSPTPSTDLQSTTSNHSEATSPALPPSPHTTSKTTQEPPTGPAPTPQEQRVEISLSFRITNRVFSDSLSNRDSEAFQNLKETIGDVYQAVYNCRTCQKDYLGYHVNEFRNGSVVADTQINFRKNPNTASRQFPSVVEDSLKNASNDALKGLKLTDVTATAKNNPPTPSSTTIHSEDTSSHTTSKTTQKPNTTTTISPASLPSTSSSSASDVVPGWGIALLVLVCIILLIALVALLLLIIYWCRRHHQGSLNLLSSRDSYHPMNEYPTYHTHGRYAAPSSKQNPYNETLPKNGTSPFSYTNPAMANDNL